MLLLKSKIKFITLDPKAVGIERISRNRSRMRVCNLCGEAFQAPIARSGFCQECKLHHELYYFHDWLLEELAVA
jgi:hypothetical protein